MEENNTNTTEKKGTMNLLPIVGVVIVLGVVGWVFWLESDKSQNKVQTQQATLEVRSTQAPQAVDKTFTVEGGSFYFKPNEIRVRKGDKVKIILTNSGGIHDFAIDELNVKTDKIRSGETTSVQFTADKTGTFEFYCSVGNHRQMGMKGNIIVE